MSVEALNLRGILGPINYIDFWHFYLFLFILIFNWLPYFSWCCLIFVGYLLHCDEVLYLFCVRNGSILLDATPCLQHIYIEKITILFEDLNCFLSLLFLFVFFEFVIYHIVLGGCGIEFVLITLHSYLFRVFPPFLFFSLLLVPFIQCDFLSYFSIFVSLDDFFFHFSFLLELQLLKLHLLLFPEFLLLFELLLLQ